jgi:outer membrane protein OmpA-like peptidoglycan-associated protein
MSSDRSRKIVIVRKKKVAGGGHHGGSWKVAYADFVTAMMAFFMVMWILGMDEKTKQAIEGYFSNPVGYKKGFGAGTSPISAGSSPVRASTSQIRLIVRGAESKRMAAVAREVARAVSSDAALKKLGAKIEVSMRKDGLRIELVETGAGEVFFPLGSTTMKPAAVIALGLIAPALHAAQGPVVIEGHTDACALRHPDELHQLGALGRARQRRAPRARGLGTAVRPGGGGARARRPPAAAPRQPVRGQQPPHHRVPPVQRARSRGRARARPHGGRRVTAGRVGPGRR